MTKLKQLEQEEYKKLCDKMDARHDFLVKLKNIVDKNGSVSGLSKEYVQSYFIFKSEGFRKWDAIKGVQKRLKRTAAKNALVRLRINNIKIYLLSSMKTLGINDVDKTTFKSNERNDKYFKIAIQEIKNEKSGL